MKVQLATRLETALKHRLRIYAAVSGRTVEDVVSKALDSYLPPAATMVRIDDAEPREALPAGQPGPA
jgi:plasmid stability protein